MRTHLRRRVSVATLAAVLAALLAPAAAGASAPPTVAQPGVVSGAVPLGGSYRALTPTRIMDTRSGLGGTRGAQTRASVAVPAAAASGSALVVTLTVVGAAQAGHAVAYDSRVATGGLSQIYFAKSEAASGFAVVATGGRLSLASSTPVNFLVDVTGYFTTAADSTSSGLFHAIAPARLIDTRVSSPFGALAAGGTRAMRVLGHGGIPSSGVSAVVISTSILSPTGSGHLTVYPTGSRRPGTGNVYFSRGQLRADRAIVPLGTGGAIDLYNGSTGSTQVVVDVTGYIADGTRTGGAYFVPTAPTETVTMTSPQQGAGVGPGGSTSASVEGAAGIPLLHSLTPPMAALVTMTATSRADPPVSGYLSSRPSATSTAKPYDVFFASTGSAAGQDVIALDSTESVNLTSSAPAGFSLFTSGYFVVPPTPPTPRGMWFDSWQRGPEIDQANVFAGHVVQIAALQDRSATGPYLLTSDGKVWTSATGYRVMTPGDPVPAPTIVSGLPLMAAVAAGGTRAYGVTPAGAVWQWGWTIVSGRYVYSQKQVAGLSGIAHVGAAGDVGYAMGSDGRTWAWGDNSHGQFGNGTTVDSATPVLVPALAGMTSISGDDTLSFGVGAAGAVTAWGSETADDATPTQASPDPVRSSCAATSVDPSGSLFAAAALCTDGTVDLIAQSSTGTSPFFAHATQGTGFTALSVEGRQTFVAMRPDGTVWKFVLQTGYPWEQIPWLTGVTAIGGTALSTAYAAGG